MMAAGLKRSLPSLSVMLLTLLAALPWGLPSQVRFFLPLLPFMAIHFWTVRSPGIVPEWLAFAAGLATDVLTHGPLGFWSLIFLLGYMLACIVELPVVLGVARQWLQFCLTIAILSLAQWLIASVYFFEPAGTGPLLWSAFASLLTYPLVAMMLRPFDPFRAAPGNSNLVRGA